MAAIQQSEKPDQGSGLPPPSTSAPLNSDHMERALQDSTDNEDFDFEAPDGGSVAWLQVLATLLISMISWGSPSAFGVYQLYYKDTLNISQSQVSWIGSIQFLLTYGMCTISGRLADAGYVRSTVGVGAFLVVFGTFMTSLGSQYWHFLLSQGFCVGIGLGTMFMPPLAVVSSYFDKKRTLALTVAATGTGIGGVVFPAIIQYVMPKAGFAWAVRVSAFVALVACGTALLLRRPRLKPRRSGPLVEWSAFEEKPYLFYAIGAFLLYWALFFAAFYINSYARNIIGFSTQDSVQLLLISNGMSIPARPLVGFIANQHVGAMNTYIVVTVAFGILTLAWMGVHDRVGMYVFTVFYGLANGLCQGMFLGSLASLTKDRQKMGTRMGMVHTIVAFATLAGPPTAGAIIDASGGQYRNAQIWAGLLILIASCFFVTSRVTKTGWALKTKV